jgi:integral membrane sensor domain MASE1
VSLVFIGAIAGLVTMFLAEIVKQSHWPKWANAVVADVMQIIAAAVVTLQTTGTSLVTWHDFGKALLGAAVAFSAAYLAVLKPIIGNSLQDKTSVQQ